VTARLQKEAPTQGLSVIVGRRRFSRLIIFPWVIYLLLIGVAFVGLSYAQTSMNSGAVTLEELRQEISTAEARTAQLRLEIARLRSPERIIQEAVALGMGAPGVPLQTVEAIQMERTLTVPYLAINEIGSSAGVSDEVGATPLPDPPDPSGG
jgi:cell division protein FtsL